MVYCILFHTRCLAATCGTFWTGWTTCMNIPVVVSNVSSILSLRDATLHCLVLCNAILYHIEGFRPEWYISTIYYCRHTPFWSETLDIVPYQVQGRNMLDFLNRLDNLHEYFIVVYIYTPIHTVLFYSMLYCIWYHTRGRYHGGRRRSSDDCFHSPTVIPPSILDKPSIMKRCHRTR